MTRGKILSAGLNGLRSERNRFLQENGFEVLAAATADEAKTACQNNPDITAVVIGYGLDAVEKTKIIRQVKERGLPVVLITAGSALTGVRADEYIDTAEEQEALVREIERLRNQRSA